MPLCRLLLNLVVDLNLNYWFYFLAYKVGNIMIYDLRLFIREDNVMHIVGTSLM